MDTDRWGNPEKIDFDELLYGVLKELSGEVNITNTFFRIENQSTKPFYHYEYLITRVVGHMFSYALRVLYGKKCSEIRICIADLPGRKVSIQIENQSHTLLGREKAHPYGALSPASFRYKPGKPMFLRKEVLKQMQGKMYHHLTARGNAVVTLELKNQISSR